MFMSAAQSEGTLLVETLRRDNGHISQRPEPVLNSVDIGLGGNID